MTSETQPLQMAEEKPKHNFFLSNIKIIARSLGFVTVAVLWISTVIIIKDFRDSYVGYYLIGVSTLVSFLEVTWILDKLACCVREGCCCKIWSIIMWVDNWKKFLLYVAMSIPLFLEEMRLILGIISGLLLILLSTLYLIKTFRITYQKTELKQVVSIKATDTRTVSHEISTQTEVDNSTPTTNPSTETPPDGGTASPANQ